MHRENTQSGIFLLGRLKILTSFSSLRALICKMLSDMVEILTLQSPHKLLKNLGALSKYAKCSQSLKKILILYLGYRGMVKKTSHATVPLKGWLVYVDSLSNSLFAHRKPGDHKEMSSILADQ